MTADTVIQIDIGTFLSIIGAVVAVLVVGPLAWIVRGLISDVKKTNDEHGKFREEVNREFVRKTDYVNALSEIKELIGRIFDKLDGKADK